LEKSEMDAMLDAADQTKAQGRRDYALLLFLYNSGARCTEATQLTVADLHYTPAKWDNAYVVLHGKGGKTRRCPLWPLTIQTLHTLVVNRKPGEHVFMNCNNVPIQRNGIYDLVKRHGRRAAKNVPSIATKRISPHIIRHSTACHLLKSGVDINTIRDWLGHANLSTTNIYAQIDLEMKAQALAKCELKGEPSKDKPWRDQPELMEFLRNL
jgi:integrase/recombinase XerD